jgi:hypothetical protein
MCRFYCCVTETWLSACQSKKKIYDCYTSTYFCVFFLHMIQIPRRWTGYRLMHKAAVNLKLPVCVTTFLQLYFRKCYNWDKVSVGRPYPPTYTFTIQNGLEIILSNYSATVFHTEQASIFGKTSLALPLFVRVINYIRFLALITVINVTT